MNAINEFSFHADSNAKMKTTAISPMTRSNYQPLPVHSLAFFLHIATTPPSQWPPVAPLWQVLETSAPGYSSQFLLDKLKLIICVMDY